MPNYLIPWHKTEVSLNAQTSVHIHYVDVHEEAKKGTTDFKPEHGKELVDQKQSYHDLAINDQYSNTLWNWESANYILATDSVHPDAIQGITTENEKHVYVYLKHNSVEDTRSKVVNQVIHYVYENGSQAAPDYNGVTLVFTQTGTRDTVTGEVVWNGEWTQTQRFESVESPTIKGYHTDRPVVEAYDIVVDNSNFDQNLDKEDTVVYVANPTEEVSRDKVVNQVIHYVYESGSQAAPDYKGVPLVFTQTGTRDTVTGEVVWDGEWTQSQRFESVASPTIKGYHTNRPVVEAYDIVVDNSNFDQNLDKEDTVVYVANPTETVSRDKVVNQVIHYVYENGSEAAPDHTSVALVFTQTGTRDTVTGEVVWDGEWTQSQRFESVDSPTIKGYHTDRPVVDAYDIVVDNSNFDQNLDKEDTVVYVADPVDPEEPKDPVDPEEPKDPVDPEEPKDPVDPEEPKDPEDPEDSKVPVQAETPTESTNDAPILPDQLSTDTTLKEVATVETKESGKVEAATTEDVSLPQTGHKHSNAGLIGLGLATIASLLGLAGTRKRKKD
ncbi:mucin-binding protein [Lactobacillus johnsonii]|uniref:LPXTG cell wall anchor domain-containing protein n=1 Tax=Lactobacillus johnsonii TaxID=33959 RepID=A0A9X5AL23_LACJH|nr:LPXTG cell wall anchor domain-containing protein [Lactobacillus johnsonii]MTE02468.1 LPXTG cell wall anchor domain-containing protein [Lactobacillus johnsonii]